MTLARASAHSAEVFHETERWKLEDFGVPADLEDGPLSLPVVTSPRRVAAAADLAFWDGCAMFEDTCNTVAFCLQSDEPLPNNTSISHVNDSYMRNCDASK